MENSPSAEQNDENTDLLHFPIDAVRDRLIQANVSEDVGPQAAIYCSAILQFLTSKVLQSAIKVVEMTDDQSASNASKKRHRNEMTDEDISIISPPLKKRRICPKDITKALQTDPSLKEWADLIQIPHSKHSPTNTVQPTINDCLNGVIIAFEGNFDNSDTSYCKHLQSSLQSLQPAKGQILTNDTSALLTKQFISNPTEYGFTYLYHTSTALSQQLKFATMSCRDAQFSIMNESPLSSLAMAMLFANKQWIKTKELTLYLNSHQNELFPSNYRPDVTIFIEADVEDIEDVNLLNNEKYGMDKLDRLLMDDYYFELLIQRVASRKYGKSKFVFFERSSLKIDDLNHCVMDILMNKKETVRIFWDAEIRAFNNIQNNKLAKKRTVYSEEKDIIAGLKNIKRGEMEKCDVVYIHISLWMKPKKEFKRLVMAHLCRFENICFYALRHHDLDQRAKQIVRWIFAK